VVGDVVECVVCAEALEVMCCSFNRVEDVEFADWRATCGTGVAGVLRGIEPGGDAVQVEEVVAGRDADAGRVVLGGGEKGFVEGGVEVFLADETFLADHGRGRDVAVDVGGDVGGHGGELSVDYVVVVFAHGGDEYILNSPKGSWI
jgi:hypothetical protein